jgi:hypothetical protein
LKGLFRKLSKLGSPSCRIVLQVEQTEFTYIKRFDQSGFEINDLGRVVVLFGLKRKKTILSLNKNKGQ